MKKFQGLLLVSDLDGTLLNAHKEISKENADAIEYFTREGGLFTFVTGRVPQGVGPVFDQLRPTVPIGCINGAGIFDPQAERYLWQLPLPQDAAQLVRDAQERFPEAGIELCGFRFNCYQVLNSILERHFCDEGLDVTESTFERFGEPIAKVLFAEKPERLEPIIRFLNAHPLAERFDFIRSSAEYYEILPKGASKGDLLLRIAAMLKIKRGKLLAVGDNENDISMLRAASVGYAVANAVEATKQAANRLLQSTCDESAIAELIHSL
ncbi:MAG: Cof-type HAD-IIB family hydrolase [Ruminococcaceae bacterium]|nr:Cof-type HAD-IIB family hydrolase [Oscillospiraceae bacterium]